MDPDTVRAKITHLAFKTQIMAIFKESPWPHADKGTDKRPRTFEIPKKEGLTAPVTASAGASSAHVSSMTKRKQGEDGESTGTKRRKKKSGN